MFPIGFASRVVSLVVVCFLLVCGCLFPTAALADKYNDRFDGNIFVVYAGNGSLVPPVSPSNSP